MADNASAQPAAATDLWEWLVVVPDKPGMTAKRLEIRPVHLANMMAAQAANPDNWKMGGPILSEIPEDPTNPSNWNFAGSAMVVKAASRQEVIDMIKNDVYVHEGVWDLENVQAWPFKPAFRVP